VFTTKRWLEHHVSHGVCDTPPKIKLTVKHENFECQSKQELQNKILRLESELRLASGNPQPSVVNNINNINNINNVNNVNVKIIVPPAFLTPDNYQRLITETPELLRTALTQHPANFISFLIRETNCNPELPLYNSVKLTSGKNPYAQISNGHKFIYETKKKIIDQLIENKRQILQEYVDEHGDKYGQKFLNRYQHYLDDLDEDQHVRKELEADIVCMLLNMSDVIGSDEWSRKLLEDLKNWNS